MLPDTMEKAPSFRMGIDSRPFSDELFAYEPISVAILKEPLGFRLKGVDISHWQGIIDFAVMKEHVDFVIMRYAYGNSFFDSKLDEYYRGLTDNNIPILAYHYITPGKNWRTHAETDRELLKTYPALYFWADVEETGGLNKSELDSWLYKYFNLVLELTGGSWETPTTGVYTSPGFWNTNLPRTDWGKKLKLWVAHWTDGAPTLPLDWSVPGKPYTFHQYTSKGDGRMYGASSTYIDENVYNGTIDEFNREFDANIEPHEESYKKVRSLIDRLRVRNIPSTSGVIKDYMMKGNITEALEEYVSGNDKWIRIGFKQWSAMYLAGSQLLEYME